VHVATAQSLEGALHAEASVQVVAQGSEPPPPLLLLVPS
jgi:hypothetical protein